MKILISSDLHFSSEPIDEYRWGLFPWLEKQIILHDVEYVILLGDYSIAKDRHSSALVNRFVQNMVYISDLVEKVIMIVGNHDYIEFTNPFFGFLSKFPDIEFYTKPQKRILENGFSCWFLPNTKNPNEEWKSLDFSSTDFIFTHMTFQGARAENGMPLNGISPTIFGETKAKIISGDVHVPQKLGKVTYVGSPYLCHFNDRFLPRLLLIDENKTLKDLIFPCLKRHTITISNEEEIQQLAMLSKNDQCKIKIPTSVPDIKSLKQKIDETAKLYGIQICKTELIADPKPKMEKIKQTLNSTSPFDLLAEYVKADHVDETLSNVGRKLLEQTIKNAETSDA